MVAARRLGAPAHGEVGGVVRAGALAVDVRLERGARELAQAVRAALAAVGGGEKPGAGGGARRLRRLREAGGDRRIARGRAAVAVDGEAALRLVVVPERSV